MKVMDGATSMTLKDVEVYFASSEFPTEHTIAVTDGRGSADAIVMVLWGDNLSFASAVFPRYPDLKLRWEKQGYQSYEQTFRPKNLPREGDGWRIDVGQVTLRPLAEPTAN